jgi:hypothetical protein
VGALRIELNRRDASGGGAGNEIEDMLAKQVEHMLTRQAGGFHSSIPQHRTQPFHRQY